MVIKRKLKTEKAVFKIKTFTDSTIREYKEFSKRNNGKKIKVIIGKYNQHIPTKAFAGDKNLHEVFIEEGSHIYTIHDNAFRDSGLSKINLEVCTHLSIVRTHALACKNLKKLSINTIKKTFFMEGWAFKANQLEYLGLGDTNCDTQVVLSLLTTSKHLNVSMGNEEMFEEVLRDLNRGYFFGMDSEIMTRVHLKNTLLDRSWL